jgi:hypothetical protein
MKNKKGLSSVIATVLIILLVVSSVAIVWAFVKNFMDSRTKSTQSCFDVESSEKVTINNYYTCYNSTIGEVQFSINIEDAEIDSLVISILAGGNSKSFTLNNTAVGFSNLRPYRGNYLDVVKLPGKNEGLTYVARGFDIGAKTDWIKIIPTIDGEQCGASDETLKVDSCVILTNN